MIRKKKFKVPLYGQHFNVVFYDDDNEFDQMFEKEGIPLLVKDHEGAVCSKNGLFYVFFATDKKGYPTPGLIAHEAKHLVNEIFIEIGYNLDRENDEPEAYLLMWVVNRIHEFLNEK
tara:strand:+ start:1144 stop:1494 length:351 start_codon:yes stop_codon:yes gene_type:complete